MIFHVQQKHIQVSTYKINKARSPIIKSEKQKQKTLPKLGRPCAFGLYKNVSHLTEILCSNQSIHHGDEKPINKIFHAVGWPGRTKRLASNNAENIILGLLGKKRRKRNVENRFSSRNWHKLTRLKREVPREI